MPVITASFLALSAGSLVVLVQSIILATHDTGVFTLLAIACSCASVAGCLVLGLAGDDMMLSTARGKTIAIFLLILWLCGTTVMTFSSPYQETGNGYFGCWAALIGALSITIDAWALFKRARAAEQLIGLLSLSSSVVLAQTVMNCGKDEGWCKGLAVWLILCSMVSIMVCVFIVFIIFGPHATDVHRRFRWAVLFLCIWWTGGTTLATFDYPYVQTGNGYFGCWIAFGSSTMLTTDAWGLMGPGGILQYAITATGGTPVGLVFVTLASAVTLAASFFQCEEGECEKFEVAAVLCSGLSLATCCAVLICKSTGLSGTRLAGAFPYIAAFLLTLWLAGTGFMTFKKPFRHTGNGFFGAWTALIAAWSLTRQSFELLKRVFEQVGSQGAEIACVLLASATLLLQASMDCADESITCEEHWAWAVVCGTVSLVACLIILAKFDMIRRVFKWVTILLFVWWSGGVGALTFAWPYAQSSNAYFACWFAVCACGSLVCVEWKLFEGASKSTPTTSPAPKPPTATQPAALGKATIVQAPVTVHQAPVQQHAIPTLLVQKAPQVKVLDAVRVESV